MLVFIIFLVIGFLGPLVHLVIKQKWSVAYWVEIYLVYLLFMQSLFDLWAFFGHAFIPDIVAAYIGWPSGSPFQFEVACADLAYGILCLLCIWIRGNFWLAAIIAQAVFNWGAAYGHIRDAIEHHNYAPGNAGALIYIATAVPLILLILWGLHRKLLKVKTE